MKQLASLLLLLLLLLIWYYGWDIYIKKNYGSPYTTLKKNENIEIKEITLDKEKITRLSNNIKGLKQDPVFRLKLNDFTTTERQPLFKEKYGSLYDKIVRQNQAINRSARFNINN